MGAGFVQRGMLGFLGEVRLRFYSILVDEILDQLSSLSTYGVRGSVCRGLPRLDFIDLPRNNTAQLILVSIKTGPDK